MYLKPSEIAKQYSLCLKTVRELIESGEIAGVRIGSQWRVSPEILEKYLCDQTKKRLTTNYDDNNDNN